MTSQSEDAPHHPSIAAIAEGVGVSLMTVSRALRNKPGVSPETKARILAKAKILGYRPNPVLGRLMHQIRHRHRGGLIANLAAVTNFPASRESAYCSRLRQHAASRAKELGFTLPVLRIGTGNMDWPGLDRVLESRGVEGVLFLPMSGPLELPPIDRDRFSIVVATSSIVAHPFHEVAPNHAANARLLVEKVASMGFRRIGFVSTIPFSNRNRESLVARLAWHHARQGLRCAPLLYSSGTPLRLAPWIHKERPDAILVGELSATDTLLSDLRSSGLPWFQANARPHISEASGLDEREDLLGSAAVDLLAGLVIRGERGIPSAPTLTSISGAWSSVER